MSGYHAAKAGSTTAHLLAHPTVPRKLFVSCGLQCQQLEQAACSTRLRHACKHSSCDALPWASQASICCLIAMVQMFKHCLSIQPAAPKPADCPSVIASVSVSLMAEGCKRASSFLKGMSFVDIQLDALSRSGTVKDEPACQQQIGPKRCKG